jgi:hypothetical protein
MPAAGDDPFARFLRCYERFDDFERPRDSSCRTQVDDVATETRRPEMSMGIDQTGNDRFSGKVHDSRLRTDQRLDRCSRADSEDFAVTNCHRLGDC